jgi:hypothetical protein
MLLERQFLSAKTNLSAASTGSMHVDWGLIVPGWESSTVGKIFTFLLAARFLTVHSQQRYGSDL